ncbi:ergothioneine biosynthesis protein EgtB [Pseudaquabacterium terrae]|uniref:ergothioneine biosynthesis protein EgtB n=1 Tax=Pseudaquabacterium terrae TaxID=2732868 RepID=UPI003CCD6429
MGRPIELPLQAALPPCETLGPEFARVRALSATLTEGLDAEDQALQSMPDASPTKWHLAHTSWFFETLLLRPHAAGYHAHDARYALLFNSYYEALGPRHPRPQRGMLSRPTLAEVWAYRRHVDAAVQHFIECASPAAWSAAAPILALGLQHEQQHQELMLTDLLHAFSLNPLAPAWRGGVVPASGTAEPLRWHGLDPGLVEIGHDGAGFAFDNELPRHRVFVAPFELANRLVSNADYRDFIDDGGYRRPALWLSDGWALAQAQGWHAPPYWQPDDDGGWRQFTLHGLQAIDPAAPVCHLSAYEAAAYAAWAGARLPTEFEWETAARHSSTDASMTRYQLDRMLPQPSPGLLGEAWQWTSSAYAPYPGFRPLAGPAAEYNGKFMVNQLVLRGGSCATPPGHARVSYRNFFPAAARWQFSGLRLARDAR